MKNLSRLFSPGVMAGILALVFALLFVGCKATLEEGGSYAPIGENADMTFYAADAAFDLAYSVVDAAFKFERDNRAALWKINPDIKRTLDKIRPQAAEALVMYSKARAAYLKTPTPTALCDLQASVAVMQNVSASAAAAIPKGN